MSEAGYVTTEELRDMVCRALEHQSLRAVAAEIGVSPTGLQKFARGRGKVYRPSRKRLLPWYRTRVAQLFKAPEPAVVAAAVDVLLRGLPADVQQAIRAELAAILEHAYAGLDGGALAAVVPPQPATRPLPPASPRIAGSRLAPASPPAGLYLLVPAEQARSLLPGLPLGTSLLELPAPPRGA